MERLNSRQQKIAAAKEVTATRYSHTLPLCSPQNVTLRLHLCNAVHAVLQCLCMAYKYAPHMFIQVLTGYSLLREFPFVI